MVSKEVKNKSSKNNDFTLPATKSTLTTKPMDKQTLIILSKLGEGYIQSKIAKMLPITKAGVNYWTKKFLSMDLIKIKFDGYPKYYSLTAKGQAIITRSEFDVKVPCQMEDYPMKFRLIADYGGLDWKKLGEPNNWEKLGIKIGKVRVEKNVGKLSTIIIHTGQIVGVHPDHCLLEAGGIIADVKAIIQDRGVMVDPVGLPLRKPIFKFYTQEAELLHNRFGNILTDDGVIDNSPPDKIPHEEYGRQTAINKLAEANRLFRLEQDVKNISSEIEVIKNRMLPALESLAKSLGGAISEVKQNVERRDSQNSMVV